jgi:hypothetical protein
MPLTAVWSVTDAHAAGRVHTAHFRKVPSQASTAGWWVDLSMAAGNPIPNYYAAAPLAAKRLDPFDGIFHGADKSPATKHLTHLGLMTPTAAMVGQYVLLDWLLVYPFVDGDAAGDVQAMDNTTALNRYADGSGVQIMATAVTPTAGAGTFTVDYVNQDGIARTSPVQVVNTTASSIANVATSQQNVAGGVGGPFLALASGDSGVQSITSVTFLTAAGGLVALSLVKPLADLAIREINTMAEVNYIATRPGAPQIMDGAYLGLIANCAGSVAAGLLTGYATFVWSD